VCPLSPLALARHPGLPSSTYLPNPRASSLTCCPSSSPSFQPIPTTTHHQHPQQQQQQHHHHHQPQPRRNRPIPLPIPARPRPPLRNPPRAATEEPRRLPLRPHPARAIRLARAPHRRPPRPTARPLRVVVDHHVRRSRGGETCVRRREQDAEGGLEGRERAGAGAEGCACCCCW
jgi:hypothetical protein